MSCFGGVSATGRRGNVSIGSLSATYSIVGSHTPIGRSGFMHQDRSQEPCAVILHVRIDAGATRMGDTTATNYCALAVAPSSLFPLHSESRGEYPVNRIALRGGGEYEGQHSKGISIISCRFSSAVAAIANLGYGTSVHFAVARFPNGQTARCSSPRESRP